MGLSYDVSWGKARVVRSWADRLFGLSRRVLIAATVTTAAKVGSVVIISGTATVSCTTAANAQGLLEFLFGRPARQTTPTRQYRRPSLTRPRRDTRPGQRVSPYDATPGRSRRDARPTRRRPSYSGKYRTLCVRQCDGYYFPISFATTRGGLKKDAKVCQARCPGQGTLFYLRSPGTDVANAKDRRGRRYADLKVAFRYRKEYVKACACRPPPWSREERMRHAMYRSDDGVSEVRVVAGRYGPASGSGARTPPPPPQRAEDHAAISGPPGSDHTAGTDHDAQPGPVSEPAEPPEPPDTSPQRRADLDDAATADPTPALGSDADGAAAPIEPAKHTPPGLTIEDEEFAGAPSVQFDLAPTPEPEVEEPDPETTPQPKPAIKDRRRRSYRAPPRKVRRPRPVARPGTLRWPGD